MTAPAIATDAGQSVNSWHPVRATERGRLVLAERVIEKIASQAASEVSAAGRRTTGLLGVGGHLVGRPKVDVELSGRTATIEVEVSVPYPTPLRQTTSGIRRHIRDRVQTLTGIDVRAIDIRIGWLKLASDPEENRSLQ